MGLLSDTLVRRTVKGTKIQLTLVVILEVRSILLLPLSDQLLILHRQSALDPLGETESDLLVDSAKNERFSWMYVGEFDIIDPSKKFSKVPTGAYELLTTQTTSR